MKEKVQRILKLVVYSETQQVVINNNNTNCRSSLSLVIGCVKVILFL